MSFKFFHTACFPFNHPVAPFSMRKADHEAFKKLARDEVRPILPYLWATALPTAKKEREQYVKQMKKVFSVAMHYLVCSISPFYAVFPNRLLPFSWRSTLTSKESTPS